jgi:hypothetical protein
MENRYFKHIDSFIKGRGLSLAAAQLGVDQMTLRVNPEFLSDEQLVIVGDQIKLPPEALVDERDEYRLELSSQRRESLSRSPDHQREARLNRRLDAMTAGLVALLDAALESAQAPEVRERLSAARLSLVEGADA